MALPKKTRTVLVVAVVLAVGTVVARMLGYKIGPDTVVRCRDGHLYSTIWIPGASFKALRLGWFRWQRCPVGGHWSFVTPVREADLSAAELVAARQRRDIRIP